MVLSFGIAALIYANSNSDTVIAYEAMTTPTIDGEYIDDDCWNNATWYLYDEYWLPYGTQIPASDFSGKIKVTWSSQTNLLYFLVEVTDDVFYDDFNYNGTNSDGYVSYDVVEVFIDEDNSGGLHVFDEPNKDESRFGTNAENAYSYHILADDPGVGNVTNTLIACDIFGKNWDSQVANYDDHFEEFAMKNHGNNKYVYEFSLKVLNDNYSYDPNDQSQNNTNISNAIVSLASEKRMGFAMAYCDNDDGGDRDNFIATTYVTAENENAAWKNADVYGELVLKNSSAQSNKGNFYDRILISPNPVNDYINLHGIDIDQHEIDIEIIDITGSKVVSSSLNASSIDVSYLQSGIYFCMIKSEAFTICKKITIQ